MKENLKNKIIIIVMSIFLFGLSFFAWFKPVDTFSDSERRSLAKFPEISLNTIFNKDSNKTFMKLFETYTLDQFPLRDKFRSIKTYTALNIFFRTENNGIYIKDGYLGKVEYPINEDSIDYATSKFNYICNTFLKDTKAKSYFVLVPDKGYYLSQQTGHLNIDYKEIQELLAEKMNQTEFIDISNQLKVDSYYKTDTHWRQEKINDVVKLIGEKTNTDFSSEYKLNTLNNPFYGVYYGQSALKLPAEEMNYLTADWMKDVIVFNHVNQKEMSLYDMNKAEGKDPYEMFISGNLSVVTIENPNATSEKELILFKDSFGSSITPLLVRGYKKITVIDIRQIQSEMLATLKDSRNQNSMVDFENADDVMFLYSTIVINNSNTLK